jgi:hypothetical protein
MYNKKYIQLFLSSLFRPKSHAIRREIEFYILHVIRLKIANLKQMSKKFFKGSKKNGFIRLNEIYVRKCLENRWKASKPFSHIIQSDTIKLKILFYIR